MNDRVLALLGIAKKARAVTSGNFLTEQAVSKGTAKLVIIADDAASNTRDGIEKITYHYQGPVLYYGSQGNARTRDRSERTLVRCRTR